MTSSTTDNDSQFERLKLLNIDLFALAAEWTKSQKNHTIALVLHPRARQLHFAHDQCLQGCLIAPDKPLWWSENQATLHSHINRSIASLEREVKYAAAGKKYFAIPDSRGRGDDIWATQSEEQEWRRTIWIDQHELGVDLPRWFLDANTRLNNEWKVIVYCLGPLLMWEHKCAIDLKALPKGLQDHAATQQYHRYGAFLTRDKPLVRDLGEFLKRCEQTDAIEYDECYEPSISGMLERLVGRYKEGLRLRRVVAMEKAALDSE